jgi:uncharacterized protein (UPF0264 family)
VRAGVEQDHLAGHRTARRVEQHRDWTGDVVGVRGQRYRRGARDARVGRTESGLAHRFLNQPVPT